MKRTTICPTRRSVMTQQAVVSRVAVLALVVALVVACSPGLHHARWASAERVCRTKVAACQVRCDPAVASQSGDCQVRLVEWVERADLSKEDPAELAELATSLNGACIEGLDRACTARARLESGASARMGEVKTKEEIERRAWAAVALEGHPKGEGIASRLAGCTVVWDSVEGHRDFRALCVSTGKGFMNDSPVAVNAGWAIAMAKVSTWRAERFLVEAEETARKKDAARKATAERQSAASEAQQEQVAERLRTDKAEAALLDNYSGECGKDPKPCDEKCKAGDGVACVTIGRRMVENPNPAVDASVIATGLPLFGHRNPKFDDARRLFKKACDAGTRIGCTWVKRSDEAQARAEKEVREAWLSVEEVGDALATKRFQHAFGTRRFGPREAPGLARMAQHIALITKDEFCPAVREFVKRVSRAEYLNQAKRHCDNHSLMGNGLAGEEVELTAQCRAVFATPCGQ